MDKLQEIGIAMRNMSEMLVDANMPHPLRSVENFILSVAGCRFPSTGVDVLSKLTDDQLDWLCGGLSRAFGTHTVNAKRGRYELPDVDIAIAKGLNNSGVQYDAVCHIQKSFFDAGAPMCACKDRNLFLYSPIFSWNVSYSCDMGSRPYVEWRRIDLPMAAKKFSFAQSELVL